MLKLNASVHSWLTRQERRLQNALVEQQLTDASVKVSNELLEEKDELESEQKQTAATAIAASEQSVHEQIVDTTETKTENTTTTTAMITVTDSNGNEVESHTTTGQQLMHSSSKCSGSEKTWNLQSLITSETEFHKHLKDEVSDMYTAWDEADSR